MKYLQFCSFEEIFLGKNILSICTSFVEMGFLWDNLLFQFQYHRTLEFFTHFYT